MGMGRSVTSYAVNLRSKKVRTLEGLIEYSPDGKQVVHQVYGETEGQYGIWIMDADGSNKRFLVTGNSPRYSPDGNTILYSTEGGFTGPARLWNMINIDGSNCRKLGRLEAPVFAGDGKHILCLSPEWQRQLWKMDRDGSNHERLQAPLGWVDFFRPCRDGFIFHLVTHDRVGDIYVVNTDDWTVERVASMR